MALSVTQRAGHVRTGSCDNLAMPPADEPKGFLARLRERINRGSASIARDVRSLLRGRKIDAAVLEDLEARLLMADLGVEATSEILSDLNRRVARHELDDVEALIDAVRERLVQVLAPCERPLIVDRSAKPFVVLVVGVNGSGKTTTIGKLAQRLRADRLSVLLAAGDTFRAAAVEQLSIWAQRTGALFSAQQTGADPGAVIFDALKSAQARDIEVVLADTAGRLHSQTHLMDELKKVKRVVQRVLPAAPHEVLLVLDANQGQNALAQAQQFHAALGVTGLVLTKLDGTARGGIVVAIARQLQLPIRFIGIGERAEDFGVFNARAFASALIEGAGTAEQAAGQAQTQ
jgi:fused signal recognition particle receptor